MTRFGLRHWLVVLLVAVAAHAALLLAFRPDREPTGGQAGSAGTRVALATLPESPRPQQASETGEPVTAKPETEPKPEPKPAPEPEAQSEPKKTSVPEPASEPSPVPTPKREPKPKPKPEPKPTPKPKPKPKPTPKPEPKPKPVTRPTPQRKPASEPGKETATDSASKRRADGGSPDTPAQAKPNAARSPAGGTGTIADTPAGYQGRLRSWLVRHKHYPRRARRLRQQGTAVLYFVMDRNGHVLDYEIRKSSGHPALDEAVKQMIRDADPLPALPASVHKQRIAITVPIRFKLR